MIYNSWGHRRMGGEPLDVGSFCFLRRNVRERIYSALDSSLNRCVWHEWESRCCHLSVWPDSCAEFCSLFRHVASNWRRVRISEGPLKITIYFPCQMENGFWKREDCPFVTLLTLNNWRTRCLCQHRACIYGEHEKSRYSIVKCQEHSRRHIKDSPLTDLIPSMTICRYFISIIAS